MQRHQRSFKPRARGKASVLDILGAHPRKGNPPAKWAEHHAELIRLRNHLSGKRQSHTNSGAAEPSTTGEHMADAATDSYDRDWELAMASSDQSLLYEIEEALNRMANGAYGVCEMTGQQIEPSRLKALPWTRFCAAAQSELEARGAARHAQLGSLGSYAGFPAGSQETEQDEDDTEEPALQRKAA
jgi:RNA polymerase-binding transcription factor DksA